MGSNFISQITACVNDPHEKPTRCGKTHKCVGLIYRDGKLGARSLSSINFQVLDLGDEEEELEEYSLYVPEAG